MLEQFKGDILNGSGHSVDSVDSADDNAPLVSTLVVADADALDVGNNGEILPHLALQTVLGKLLAQNGIGLADGFQTVAGDGTQAADAQTGAGEGLTITMP